MAHPALRPLVSIALVSLALSACSSAAPPGDEPMETGAGAGGGGAFGSSATPGSGQGGDVSLSPGAGGSGAGSAGGFDACATSSQDAALVPVNMFLTVDKSGSMAYDGKWANARAGFTAFFQAPAAADLRVALRLWPQDKCSAPACSVAACGDPNVDVGPLSDAAHVQALVSTLAGVTPNGNTPMHTALAGATQWAADYMAQAKGSERAVVVLVTDGDPNGCIDNLNQIAAVAKHAYNAAGVLTFTVGMPGATQSTLDLIAQAGGTGHGYFVGNGNTGANLLSALQAIETSSASCVYAMPQAAAGESVDPALVNVTYLPTGSSTPEPVDQVPDAASCGSSGGWYYDDPTSPRFINLCANSCQGVKADPSAKIRIVLGCATKTA